MPETKWHLSCSTSACIRQWYWLTLSNCNLLLWSTTHTVHLIHSANVCWWSTLCWSLVPLCWLVSRWRGLNSSMQQHSGPSWWHGSPTHWVPASRVSQWWGPQVGQLMPWASHCPMACMWLDINLLCKVFSLPCGLLFFSPGGLCLPMCSGDQWEGSARVMKNNTIVMRTSGHFSGKSLFPGTNPSGFPLQTKPSLAFLPCLVVP